MTGDYNEEQQPPILASRSLRMNSASFKNGMMGKKISFNTGAMRRRSHQAGFMQPLSSRRSNYFDQFNRNQINNSDEADHIKLQSVALPSLTPKATI